MDANLVQQKNISVPSAYFSAKIAVTSEKNCVERTRIFRGVKALGPPKPRSCLKIKDEIKDDSLEFREFGMW